MKNSIKNSNNHWQEIIVFSLILVAYVPVFFWMWGRWFARDSYYSHGILIPFVCGYLIWQMKDELKMIQNERSPHGIVFIFLGLLIYFFCAKLRIYFASGFSILFVLAGAILHFYGQKKLKKLFFPLFFLCFMIPLPEVAIINLSFNLKMFAAQIATGVLNIMKIKAVQFGSIIQMKSSQVVVDDVCSGLRSLVSLLALGSIFSFWMKSVWWKRGLLFVSTIPIAIITNVCRVVFLSFVSEIWGAHTTRGIIHDLSGFMIFGVAFILLVSFKNVLEEI